MHEQTVGPGFLIADGTHTSYAPRHAAPELDATALEEQARAADDYRYSQMFRQFLAEYAMEHGPFTDTTPERREKFINQQRRRVARAIQQQAIAQRYANDKRLQIQTSFGDFAIYETVYEGRHRAPDEDYYSEPSVDITEQESDVGVPATPDSATVDELLERGTALEEASAAQPGEHRSLRDRLKTAWYAAGAATAAYFLHPEKGRRRQVLAVLGGYAATAVIAYLIGRGQLHTTHQELITGQSPATPPPTTPEASPPLTEHFYNDLQPQDYHGQTYEWGAVADSSGPANATPQLSDMVHDARAHGAEVETWGSASSGHWGITYVEVPLANGSSKAYYDTQHKLAILQYLSELSEYDPQANGR
jgi:hypothetical protein